MIMEDIFKKIKPYIERHLMLSLIVIEIFLLAAATGKALLTERYTAVLTGEDMPVYGRSIPLDAGYYQLDIYYQDESHSGSCQVMYPSSYGTVKGEIIYLVAGNGHVQTNFELSKATYGFTLHTEEDGAKDPVFTNIIVQELPLRDIKICFLLFSSFLLIDTLLFLKKRGILQNLDMEQKLVAACLCIACLLASAPLFLNYLVASQDYAFHLMRIEGLADALRSGEFPVKMQTTWLNGYGYPISLMYGDLLLYFPALLRLIGFSLQGAYQIYCFMINVATALISYFCVKTITQKKMTGLAAAILYTWASYRIICMYIRNAVGEFTAMTFFPLIFLGLYLLFHTSEKKKGCLCMIIGYTLILESHMLSFEMAILLSALYCLLNFKKFTENFVALAKAAGVTILLNLGFLIPVADYMLTQNLSVKDALANIEIMQAHGLFLPQLFQMFGFRGNGTYDVSFGMGEDMALTLGFPFLLILILWIMEVWLCGTRLKEKVGSAALKEQVRIFCLMVVSLLMTCYFFPWTSVQRIPLIGKYLAPYLFAWRFLGLASVFGIMLAGFALKNLKLIAGREIRIAVISVIAAFALLNITFFTNYILCNTYREVVMSDGGILYTSIVIGGEYLPVGTDVTQFHISCLAGDGVTVNDLREDGQDYIVNCKNATGTESSVTIPRLFYKGYVAVDAQSSEGFEITNGENNRIQIQLPAGYEGSIRVKFSQPLLWRIAELISFATLLSCAFLRYYRKRQAIAA